VVHELGEGFVSEFGIRKDFPFCYNASSWHVFLSSGLPGILAIPEPGLTGIEVN